jgi:hypothetical protein
MNIAKVSKTTAFVNYVKPGMEMVDLETEGSLLLTASFIGTIGEKGDNQVPETINDGSLSGRSGRARMKR